MSWFRNELFRWQTLILFAAALCVRLIFAPLPGFWGDTNLLVEYARVTAQKGLLGVNGMDDASLYPAGYIYHSYAIGHIFKNKLRSADDYPKDGMTAGGASIIERMAVRTLPIAYDLMIGVALLVILGRCVSRQGGEWGAAIYLFNPGVIANSAVWNYDSLPSFYQLLAVIFLALALQKGRDIFWLLTWLAAGLAVGMKLQAGMLVPVLAVVTLCTRRLKLVLLAPIVFFAVLAAIFSPFVIGHAWAYLRRVFIESFVFYPVTHAGAYNLWGLWFQRPVTERVAGLTLESIGRGLFLGAMAWVSWWVWRLKVANGADAFRRAAIVFTYVFVAPFVLLTRMHERYLAPAVAVAVLAGLLDRRFRGAMWGISAAYAINMLAILTQGYWHVEDAEIAKAIHISYSVVRFFCCSLIVGAFFWVAWQLPTLLKGVEPETEPRDNLGRTNPSPAHSVA